jgi:YegS/Rv2252/BmrU family lipid kinase
MALDEVRGMVMRVSVIVNPGAGAGRARRILPKLRRRLEGLGVEHEILETRHRGHATELARRARDSGCGVLAVLGGDGTLNEVCQAYIDASGALLEGPPLALVPAGTGGDFARLCSRRGVAITHEFDGWNTATLRPLDLGVVTLNDETGAPFHRAFVNVASAGISGEVDERVERGPKWLGGKAAFLLATVTAALSYRNEPLELEIDDRPFYRGPVLLTAIANGQFLGGGMHIAPEADFADGLLDVICVGDVSRARFLNLFPLVYRGAHLGLDVVRAGRGRRVSVRPLGTRPILVDVDGETPGFLPLTAQIFPSALRLASA